MVLSDWSELGQRKKIALFVGADVVAHSLLNKVVPDMIARGYTPIIYLPDHLIPASKVNAHQKELKEAAFFERYLSNNVIYPFMKAKGYEAKTVESPEQLAAKFSKKGKKIDVLRVTNVNDPKFISDLSEQDNVVGMISIRCFQIFSKSFIKSFSETQDGRKRFLFNLHPGKLPEFKGVLSAARAMDCLIDEINNGVPPSKRVASNGWTLHEIDDGIDTGAILWSTLKAFDLNNSVLQNSLSTIDLGAQSIRRALDELDAGNILSGVSQGAHRDKFYHSYPTPRRVTIWKEKGISLVNPFRDYDTLIEKFGPAAEEQKQELTKEVLRAVHSWYRANDPTYAKRRLAEGKIGCAASSGNPLFSTVNSPQDVPQIAYK